MARKLTAEFIGTFILVFGGCGAAAISGGGIGTLGISLAFGLTVLGCAYALGPVSGCHLNPAVSIGLATGGRFAWKDVPGYALAQVLGAIAASGVLLLILDGDVDGYDAAKKGLAANGYDLHSPGKYSMTSGLIAEVVLTFIFLVVILGVTARSASVKFAGIAIGLTLTLIHLIGIPVTNVSVNPARSTGPALFVGGWALEQLWLFWLAPIGGAVLAGLTSRLLTPDTEQPDLV
ncbi:MAG: aquaporin Z [Myxococcota bacterium]|jgi:aquaporin Z